MARTVKPAQDRGKGGSYLWRALTSHGSAAERRLLTISTGRRAGGLGPFLRQGKPTPGNRGGRPGGHW